MNQERPVPEASPDPADPQGLAAATAGTVYLVGAGPGDPGLLTLRAARLLATCDLVAYDRLAPAQILELVPPNAERIRVGKDPDPAVTSWTQPEIDALLVNEARAGRAVVRLKGGDPFVFGRGGEEALACRAAGIPVEVVPGVSSAVAVPAAAGIPVTHRGVAAGVAFVTGHEDPTKPASQLDWDALARFPGTLVFLMGVANAGRIARMLVAHGHAPRTPAAVVACGTTRGQRTLVTDLASLAEDLRRSGLANPATIVVGDVVGLRARLGDLGALAAATTASAEVPDPNILPTALPA